jgi:hypothetical protein
MLFAAWQFLLVLELIFEALEFCPALLDFFLLEGFLLFLEFAKGFLCFKLRLANGLFSR